MWTSGDPPPSLFGKILEICTFLLMASLSKRRQKDTFELPANLNILSNILISDFHNSHMIVLQPICTSFLAELSWPQNSIDTSSTPCFRLSSVAAVQMLSSAACLTWGRKARPQILQLQPLALESSGPNSVLANRLLLGHVVFTSHIVCVCEWDWFELKKHKYVPH